MEENEAAGQILGRGVGMRSVHGVPLVVYTFKSYYTYESGVSIRL